MSETAKMNPLVGIAAVAVTAASLVGVGVMTGFIPTKSDKATPPAETATAPAAVAAAPATPAAPIAAAPEPAKKVVVAEAPRVATPPPAPRPVAQQQPRPAPTYPAANSTYPQGAPAPQYPATYDYPPTAPAPSAYPPAVVAQAPAACTNCGRVEAVNVQNVSGEGSGLGAVAGGVAGALLGNQIGGGTGRKVATVAGAAGGAFAGHQVEKYAKSGKRFDVVVRMDDGSSRTFPYESEPGFRAGDRIRVVEGKLQYN